MPHAVPSDDTAEVLHVFDLPQLHSRPATAVLLAALDLLTVQPPSWERGDKNGGYVSVRPQVAPEGVTKYLTSIIGCQLSWIKDDGEREAIWEEASLRLAERSGRSAMSDMTRTFNFPSGHGAFDLKIYEPALTGDCLGFKTWAASFLLSKRLHTITIPRSRNGQLRALELGAGTGLVGMALAAVHGASVLLTDLPEIEVNLARNVKYNASTIQQLGGYARTAVLDWTEPQNITTSTSSVRTTGKALEPQSNIRVDKFPLIVAADSIYSPDHPALLVGAIETWLSPQPDAWVILEMPRRSGYEAELKDLKQRMLVLGLQVLAEGEETGYDDWGGDNPDELQEVNCWWSIWSWAM